MAGLPAASVATNSGATEGDVKNWMTQTHDYLAGLFGTSGLVADALAALSLGNIVRKFNGRQPDAAGGITLNVGDITGVLGFTPAPNSAIVGITAITKVNIDGKIGCGIRVTQASGSTFDVWIVSVLPAAGDPGA
jgi:hypothetical protein